MHSQILFGSFRISTLCSVLLFLRSKFLFCYTNSLTSLFWKLNLLSFTISITLSVLWRFLLAFTDFPQLNSSKVLILFLSFFVAFLTKPYNCRLSSSIFLVSIFHWAISYFWSSIFFIFTFLISCLGYLHFIATCFLDHSFPSLFQQMFFQVYLFNCLE